MNKIATQLKINPALLAFICLASAGLLALGYRWLASPIEHISDEDKHLLKQLAIHEPRIVGDLQAQLLKSDDKHSLSENLAQTILHELKNFPETGAELQQALLKCSAEFQYQLHPERKTCTDNYMGEPDFACMQKRGWGKKDLRQILYAQKIDLNGDAQDDYIVSDRYYCHELSANSGNVYFVLLSDGKKLHHLAYAGWASEYLEARRNPKNNQIVLTEVLERNYGKYTQFYQLDKTGLRYRSRICLIEDKEGTGLCPDKAKNTQ